MIAAQEEAVRQFTDKIAALEAGPRRVVHQHPVIDPSAAVLAQIAQTLRHTLRARSATAISRLTMRWQLAVLRKQRILRGQHHHHLR